MVGIVLESFVQQSLCERLVLVDRTAPSFHKDLGYCRCKADLRGYRFRIHCQRLLEERSGLLSGRYGSWPMPPRPSAHHEIASIGIDLVLLLNTPGCRHHELAI